MQIKYLVIPALAALAACGGGGNNGGPLTPSPPPPPPGPTSNSTISNLQVAETFTAAEVSTQLAVSGSGEPTNISGTLFGRGFFNRTASVAYNPAGESFTLNIETIGNGLPGLTFSQSDIDTSESTPDFTYYENANGLLFLLKTNNSVQALDYATFGIWGFIEPSQGDLAVGYSVFGIQTASNDMPTTGTATYNGIAYGSLFDQSTNPISLGDLSGTAQVTADFGTGDVNATLAFDVTPSDSFITSPWGLASGAGSIGAANSTVEANAFQGTLAFTPDGSLTSTGSGEFYGGFFGPDADEVAGRWHIIDGSTIAFGAFAAGQ